MVKQLTDIVYTIDVPLPGNPLRNLNSFLVKGKERNLLIDTGFNMPESFNALAGGLYELGVEINNTDIMITHLHSDHAGLAPTISGPGSEIYMSRPDLEIFSMFSDPEFVEMLDNMYLSFGMSEKELNESKSVNPAMLYLPEKHATYIPVEDGHVFDLGTCSLECIMTPGHTPGHICLYDRENKIFFSGDHIIFGISPNITSWTGIPDSLGLYIESLKNIKKLEIGRTFSAHRQIEGDAKKRIDELLRHHEERLAEVESSVMRREKADVNEIASDLTWSVRAREWNSFPVAQKWFALGEAHSHLEHLRVLGKIKSTVKDGLIYYSPV